MGMIASMRWLVHRRRKWHGQVREALTSYDNRPHPWHPCRYPLNPLSKMLGLPFADDARLNFLSKTLGPWPNEAADTAALAILARYTIVGRTN